MFCPGRILGSLVDGEYFPLGKPGFARLDRGRLSPHTQNPTAEAAVASRVNLRSVFRIARR